MTKAVKQLRKHLDNGPHDTYEVYDIADAALSALEAVLAVLDGYTMPSRLHDPTGYAGDELETLEGYIREAIQEVLGDDDGS